MNKEEDFCLQCREKASYVCRCCYIAHYCCEKCQRIDFELHKYETDVIYDDITFAASSEDINQERRVIFKVKEKFVEHAKRMNDTTRKMREFVEHAHEKEEEMNINMNNRTSTMFKDDYTKRMIEGSRSHMRKGEKEQLQLLKDLASIFHKEYNEAEIMTNIYVPYIRKKHEIAMNYAFALLKSDTIMLNELHQQRDLLKEEYIDQVFNKWLLQDLVIEKLDDNPDYKDKFTLIELFNNLDDDMNNNEPDHIADAVSDIIRDRVKTKTEKILKNYHESNIKKSSKRKTVDETFDDDESSRIRRRKKMFTSLNAKSKDDNDDDEGEEEENKRFMTEKEQVNAVKDINIDYNNKTIKQIENNEELYSNLEENTSRKFVDIIETYRDKTNKQIDTLGEYVPISVVTNTKGFIGKIYDNMTNMAKSEIGMMISNISEGRTDWSSGFLTAGKYIATSLTITCLLVWAIRSYSMEMRSIPGLFGMKKVFEQQEEAVNQFAEDVKEVISEKSTEIQSQTMSILQKFAYVKMCVTPGPDITHTSHDITSLTTIDDNGIVSFGVKEWIDDMEIFNAINNKNYDELNMIRKEHHLTGTQSDLFHIFDQARELFNNYGSTIDNNEKNTYISGIIALYKERELLVNTAAGFDICDITEQVKLINSSITDMASKFKGLHKDLLNNLSIIGLDFEKQSKIIEAGLDKLAIEKAPLTRSLLTNIGVKWGINPGATEATADMWYINGVGNPFIIGSATEAYSMEYNINEVLDKYYKNTDIKGFINDIASNGAIDNFIKLGVLSNMIKYTAMAAPIIGYAIKGVSFIVGGVVEFAYGKVANLVGSMWDCVYNYINPISSSKSNENLERRCNDILNTLNNTNRSSEVNFKNAQSIFESLLSSGNPFYAIIDTINNHRKQKSFSPIKSSIQVIRKLLYNIGDILIALPTKPILHEIVTGAKFIANGMLLYSRMAFGATIIERLWNFSLSSFVMEYPQMVYEYITGGSYIIPLAIIGVSIVVSVFIDKTLGRLSPIKMFKTIGSMYFRLMYKYPTVVLSTSSSIITTLSFYLTPLLSSDKRMIIKNLSGIISSFNPLEQEQTKQITDAAAKYATELEKAKSQVEGLKESFSKYQLLELAQNHISNRLLLIRNQSEDPSLVNKLIKLLPSSK